MTARFAAIGIIVATTGGCTTFSTVRSAEVYPGPSFIAQMSASTPPGRETSSFWSYDCAECDYPVIASELGWTWGTRYGRGVPATSLGVGLNGSQIFVDGYLQLSAGSTPFGIGGRTSLPALGGREYQLYWRTDFKLGPRARLLLNPALFIHIGNSSPGEEPGSFVGFVQGTGLLLEGERVSFTPAITLVAGRTKEDSFSQRERTVFGTASLSVTWHRSRQ